MKPCKECGSWAINHHSHGRDGSDGDLCDVCYWRKRAALQQITDIGQLQEPARNVTAQEDSILRGAARRSATVVAAGKLVQAEPAPRLTDAEMLAAIRPLYQNDWIAQQAFEVSIDEYRAIEARVRGSK